MAKERNYNPVQAQRKADKAKAIKKGKADVAAARNERLAKKNPERLRKQIADLKAITEGGGTLTHHEEQVLEGLEKELKAVVKAREALGDRAPPVGGGGGGGGGRRFEGERDGRFDRKRRRDASSDSDDDDDDGDVPEDVRAIPMPRDTPPPIPKAVLDAWYEKRRARARARHGGERQGQHGSGQHGSSANAEPLGGGGGGRTTTTTEGGALPAPAPVVAKTVYEAKPVLRDLQKEAVSAFMPTVVRRKLEKSRGATAGTGTGTGTGHGLLEPEEADQLEREGYLKTGDATGTATAAATAATAVPAVPPASTVRGRHQATLEDAVEDEG